MAIGDKTPPLPRLRRVPCLAPRTQASHARADARAPRPPAPQLQAGIVVAERYPWGLGRGVRLTMTAGAKRRIIVVLRWVMAIALSYLVLFSARDPAGWRSGLCIALLLASNLVLMRLPEATFHHPAFDPVLVAADTALITAALWICGSAGPDFFFVFFFVVFLAALGGRLELTALGAALAAVAYLSVLPAGVAWTSAALLRVPFFFVTALSYGYLASGAREAESRARAAEEVLALKTAFLGTVSHEMRSPLSVILGYTDMFRDGVFGTITPA